MKIGWRFGKALARTILALVAASSTARRKRLETASPFGGL